MRGPEREGAHSHALDASCASSLSMLQLLIAMKHVREVTKKSDHALPAPALNFLPNNVPRAGLFQFSSDSWTCVCQGMQPALYTAPDLFN